MALPELSGKLSAIQQAINDELAASARKTGEERDARQSVINKLEEIFPNNSLGKHRIPTLIAGKPGELTITAIQGQDRYFEVATDIAGTQTRLLSIKVGRAFNANNTYPDTEYLNGMLQIVSRAAEVLGIQPTQTGDSSRNQTGPLRSIGIAPIERYSKGDIPI